ncbi:MAG: hypothetical protein ACOZCO_15785 [Bacteroidota bacterium]
MSEKKEKGIFHVKPYKLKELCEAYKMSPYTFKKHLKAFKDELGKRIGQYYTPKQVSLIISKMGIPGTVDFK